MMYQLRILNDSIIFTGDCLFEGGTGMFFEGTPLMMRNIMNGVKMGVKPTTRLFFGHNYGYWNYLWANDLIKQIEGSLTISESEQTFEAFYELKKQISQRF